MASSRYKQLFKSYMHILTEQEFDDKELQIFLRIQHEGSENVHKFPNFKGLCKELEKTFPYLSDLKPLMGEVDQHSLIPSVLSTAVKTKTHSELKISNEDLERVKAILKELSNPSFETKADDLNRYLNDALGIFKLEKNSELTDEENAARVQEQLGLYYYKHGAHEQKEKGYDILDSLRLDIDIKNLKLTLQDETLLILRNKTRIQPVVNYEDKQQPPSSSKLRKKIESNLKNKNVQPYIEDFKKALVDYINMREHQNTENRSTFFKNALTNIQEMVVYSYEEKHGLANKLLNLLNAIQQGKINLKDVTDGKIAPNQYQELKAFKKVDFDMLNTKNDLLTKIIDKFKGFDVNFMAAMEKLEEHDNEKRARPSMLGRHF